MSIVTTNRTLQKLRQTGYVDHIDGQLVMMDWDRLISLGEFNPAYLHMSKRGSVAVHG